MYAQRSRLAIATLILLVPAAQGTWYVGGTYEPDTPYDSPDLMWANAPGALGTRIYFNAWAMSAPLGVAGASPNVGLLHSQIEVPAHEYQYAVFGVWLDCNLDGYIGAAEHGLREYSAALLLDSGGPCRAEQGDDNVWPMGAHNYNGWVSEYVPIANDPDVDDRKFDLRVYEDPSAMVWGDYHRPDELPFHRSCALAPQPRGFYQSTGGSLNYVDCRADVLGVANEAFDATGDPLGLRFSNENDARTSPLGQIQTAGSDDSQYTAAYVADCDEEPILRVGDVINDTTDDEDIREQTEDVHDIRIMPADPRPGNPNPTAPGTMNQTVEELYEDCDTSNDEGHDFYGNSKLGTGLPFYVGEEDFNGIDPNNKHEADWNFGFAIQGRGPPVNTDDPLSEDPSDPTGMPGTDLGVGWLGLSGSSWFGPSVWATKPGPSILREDIGGSDPLAPAYWLTYYAHASSTTYARGFSSPGGSGVYGSFYCGTQTSGIHNQWNCDVDTWYKNMDGSNYIEPYPFARPGQRYEFRDVDCYDGGVGDSGIGVLPAYYGNEACP